MSTVRQLCTDSLARAKLIRGRSSSNPAHLEWMAGRGGTATLSQRADGELWTVVRVVVRGGTATSFPLAGGELWAAERVVRRGGTATRSQRAVDAWRYG